METDVNVIAMMLVFLGLGSSLIHYSRFAKMRAMEKVGLDLENQNVDYHDINNFVDVHCPYLYKVGNERFFYFTGLFFPFYSWTY